MAHSPHAGDDPCYNADMSAHTQHPYLMQARQVLQLEQDGIAQVANQLDQAFVAAVERILAARGRVVVTGMGKSGHIARKLAATLASTGTPAFFVHPAEAAHGDLGMIVADDVVLALSNSGESEEVLAILPALKRKGMSLIGISGRPNSTLARQADIHLNAAVAQEACPHGLAPTTSTTAALALGDALAVVLLQARQFSPNDFALSHPAGSLGKRLLVRVADLMHHGADLPVVAQDTDLREAIVTMSEKGLGLTAVTDDAGQLCGVFTDGDLRRLFQTRNDFIGLDMQQVMGRAPKTIGADKLASEALHRMQTERVNALLVVDEHLHLVGALNMHDLLKAGIV